MQLKKYQSIAIESIVGLVKQKLINDVKYTFTFSSPTGSGKTFIAIKSIDNIISDIDLIKNNIQVCFLWTSVGKGGLHIQSYNRINSQQRKCNLLKDLLSVSRKRIKNNEIMVVNWEQIKSDHNKSRQVSEHYTFDELIYNTKKIGRKIILIIDESHYASDTEKARDVIKVISPDITIKMTATPREDSTIIVPYDDVVREEMIKCNILGNYFDDNVSDEISDKYIIKNGYEKRLIIKNEFIKLKKNINPLCLIQIPNYSKGDKREENRKSRVIKILEELGERIENIGIYLDNEKINVDYKNNFNELRKHNNNINFLIFKTAIDTGWDCNRSHILVKLRDIKSPIFLTQTIGRIIRTPEQKHYKNKILDNAYVYADITDPNIIEGIYNFPNYKDLSCKVRNDISVDIKLPTYYNTPTGKKSLKNGGLIKYTKIFDDFIEKNIDIDKLNLDLSRPKHEISNKFDIKDKIINDEKEVIEKELSDLDIQSEITIKLYSICQNLIPSQSEPILRALFREYFKKKLSLNETETYILFYNNEIYFNNLLEKFIKEKCEFEDMSNWQPYIWEPQNYEEEMKFRQRNYKYYLYTPAAPYLGDSSIEGDFNDFIENTLGKDLKLIEWWVKNKSKSKIWFGIKCIDTNSYPFYPDYLIKFKNGYLGILDTKLGLTELDEIKPNALQKYISDRKNEGMKIFGGLIIPGNSDGVYYINESYPYKIRDENKKNFLEYIFNLNSGVK